MYLVQKVRTLDSRSSDDPIEFYNLIDFGSKEKFKKAMLEIKAKEVYAGKKYVFIKKCDFNTIFYVPAEIETYDDESVAKSNYDLKYGFEIAEVLRGRLGKNI